MTIALPNKPICLFRNILNIIKPVVVTFQNSPSECGWGRENRNNIILVTHVYQYIF